MTDINKSAEVTADETPGAGPPPEKSRVSNILLVLGIVVVVVVLTGAAVGVIKLRQSSEEPGAGASELPAYVYDFTAPTGTPDAYAAAARYADDFSRIPCYCGCARDPGHKSLLDCFISARDGNNISYDSHAAG